MAEQPTPALRILIGAESASDAPRALRLLPILTGGAPAQICGLLVLESAAGTLHRAAGRVVTTQGEIVAAPTAERMKKIAAAQTRAFRQMLADFAGPSGAQWTIEVKIGALGDSLAATSSAWDIVVIGHRMLHRRRGAVVMVSGGPRDGGDLHAVASRLAGALETNVEVVRPPVADAAPDPFRLARHLDRMNASVVLLDAATLSSVGLRRLHAVLTAARCPVVILGTAGLQPQLEHSVLVTPAPEADR